jgi:hypothetical protein
VIPDEPVRGRTPPPWFRALNGMERYRAFSRGLVQNWPISGARAIGLLLGAKLATVGWAVTRLSRRLDAAGDRVAAVRSRLR